MNVRIFHRVFFVFSTAFLLELFIYAVSTQAVQNSDGSARAERAIAQMRRAVFGETKLESVKGLSLSWKTLHQRPGGALATGEVICDLFLPDKMLTKNTRTLSSNRGQVTAYRLLNGKQSWSDTTSSNSEIPVVRIGGSPTGNDQVKMLQAIQREQAIQLLRLALPPSSDFPLTFTYAGEAQASDGQADVIDVKGPNDFSARLFIDKASSRLLMMTLPDAGFRLSLNSLEVSEGRAALPKDVSSKATEARFRFSEYRSENGVLLPHLITHESDGMIVTEYELRDFKINPVFALDHFDPGKKRK